MISLIAKKNIQYNDVYAGLSTDTKGESGYGNGASGSKWIELDIETESEV